MNAFLRTLLFAPLALLATAIASALVTLSVVLPLGVRFAIIRVWYTVVLGLCHALLDGLAHARNRQQVQRLLNGLPILGRHQHGAAAFAGNQDGLVRFGRLVDKTVQICACFTGGDGRGHGVLLWSQNRTPKRTLPL